jgi:Ser/Thr protein kinase RdoA (MazF antagonist)
MADAGGVAAILRACGLRPGAVAPVTGGVTAAAWRAETDAGPVAVLVERPECVEGPRRVRAAFEARHGLLARLHALDARTPRPIATNVDAGERDPLEGTLPWSVATFVDGAPLDSRRDEETSASGARPLGALLRALHGLPAEGHGMLADDRDALHGVAADPAAGLLVRWPRLWPFDGRPLVEHPIVRTAPHLVGGLAALRAPLLRWAEPGVATVVCHGDLKPEHVRVDADAALAGLIDFGDAMVAARGWDFASFAWHGGWPLLDALLEGYESKRVLREMLCAEAELLAVPLVLGYFDRDVRRRAPAAPAARPRTLEFLEATIPLALRHAR